ncbi:dual specificity protein phosphatase family protein [Catenovulum maritimum]|uniref:Protein phosphatase n=1 Tax=Catenovulum maritimum TaxID=1513271 RepID=A0A0J8GRG8_9ALTE|nr:dual specificity protein phosphatase family protein [Catenovulum maritimum]KMT63869.1 protein phosphatase [Catenovulum maritimum]
MQHPTFPLKVNELGAEIIITPCPGTKDVPLAESISQLKQAGAVAVLTFMQQFELEKNNVTEIKTLCEQAGIQWFHLPIQDDQAPEEMFQTPWQQARKIVHQLLDSNQKIAVHCKGGTGRTGLVSAQILLERGWSLADASKAIKALRPNSLTLPPHVNYLEQLAQKMA